MTIVWGNATVGVAAIMLAACATPSDRIATELARFGISQGQAACIGERLEARLSFAQLRQLANAANASGKNDPNPGQLTAGDLARVAGYVSDIRVPIEVATASARCGIL